jgi:hypothetical protein
MMTSNHRGGFYSGRAALPTRNRAFTAPHGRTYGPGPRQKFAVSADGNGGHSVTLAVNEVATLTVNEDGTLTIEVQNKPENGNNGGNGNGNGAAEQNEPVEVAHQVNRMSWERNTSDGSVTFTPADDEVLSVSGDATHASVIVEPIVPPPFHRE